jgi:hypothetical protein
MRLRWILLLAAAAAAALALLNAVIPAGLPLW